MRQLRFAALATVAMFFTASAFAAKYAVGTCLPNLLSYNTISQAVSSVPSGSTIEVCPGNYPEQVLITQPLTLEAAAGVPGEAVITVPADGLTQTIEFDFVGIIMYQVLIQSAGTVNITGIAVDANGATGRGYVVGIVYLDSSGTANHLSLRNEINGDLGVGLEAITSQAGTQTVTVLNSVFRGFDGAGVSGITLDSGLTLNVTSNTINGSSGNNTAGVELVGASGTVQSNQITGTIYGIALFPSSATVKSNTIYARGQAIEIYAGSASVTNNTIDAGGALGVIMMGAAANSLVQHNTIANSSTAVYGCDLQIGFGPATGFNVTANTLTDAAVGLEMPSGNTTTPNNYYLTTNAVQACPIFGPAAKTLLRKRPEFIVRP